MNIEKPWRNENKLTREARLAANGYCPVCEIRADSPYHVNCRGMLS